MVYKQVYENIPILQIKLNTTSFNFKKQAKFIIAAHLLYTSDLKCVNHQHQLNNFAKSN